MDSAVMDKTISPYCFGLYDIGSSCDSNASGGRCRGHRSACIEVTKKNQVGKRPVRSYRNLHKGRPVAVLGGGPNLPDDLKLLPEDTIKISVNHHALTLTDCEYMVFLDNQDKGKFKACYTAMINFRGVKVTPGHGQKYSDVSFIKSDFPHCPISSTFGLWLAELLGGSPVILCGMDLYQNKVKSHCDSDTYGQHPDHRPLEFHLGKWSRHECMHKENIYVCSGPLVGYFKQWKGRK